MKKLIFYFILISGFQNIFTSQQALFDAIDKKNYSEIEALLMNPKVYINLPKEPGGTIPLHWAVDNRDIIATEILLKAGANVDAQDDDRDTPLLRLMKTDWEFASHGDNDDNDPKCIFIMELLFKYRANPDIQDNKGNTFLMQASLHGYKNIVEIIVNNKANLNIRNKENQTALDKAFSHEFDHLLSDISYCQNKMETIFILLDEYYKNYLKEQNQIIEALYLVNNTTNLPIEALHLANNITNLHYDINTLIREYTPYYNFFDYIAEQSGKPLPENYIPIIKKFLETKIKRKSNRPSLQIGKIQKTDDEMVDD